MRPRRPPFSSLADSVPPRSPTTRRTNRKTSTHLLTYLLSFDILTNSFAHPQNSTPLFSSNCELFCKNTRVGGREPAVGDSPNSGIKDSGLAGETPSSSQLSTEHPRRMRVLPAPFLAGSKRSEGKDLSFQRSNTLFSITSALFSATAHSQPLCHLSLAHSFHRNGGGACDGPAQRPTKFLHLFCFDILTNSFALHKNSTLSFSTNYELFCKNTRGGGVPHKFYLLLVTRHSSLATFHSSVLCML